MLEIDEDSRLGRELIAGGTRYHAHFVPDEELTTDLYVEACHTLNAAGVCQYEISNFARAGSPTRGTQQALRLQGWPSAKRSLGWESRHNLKYWTRQPYLGFGVDAHSMLPAAIDPYVLLRNLPLRGDNEGGSRPCAVTAADVEAVRFANPDSLEAYLAGAPPTRTIVSRSAAREEEFFLGLRLTRGVDLRRIGREYSYGSDDVEPVIRELVENGLLERDADCVRLTERGRLLSNEVFARFLA
jgi:oxygen-independent coproporphyrinogen-3 oxidase